MSNNKNEILKRDKDIRKYYGCYPVLYSESIEFVTKLLKLKRIMCSVGWLSDDLKKQQIHNSMRFNGLVFIDNGMFQRKSYKRKYTWDEVCQYRQRLIEWYKNLQPDIVSSLDIPSSPELNKKERLTRINWSVINYKFMIDKVGSIPLVLGSSIHSRKELEFFKKCIISNRINPNILGLGGQVPILRSVSQNPKIGKEIIKTIFQMSKVFPKIPIHVYGLGEHRWYLLIRLLGAKSSDYASYMKISGCGRILLPGLRPKFISKKIRVTTKSGEKFYTRPTRDLFKPHELLLLRDCECPICKNNDPAILEESRKYRIIHNLYVILSETDLMDRLCKENNDSEIIHHVISRLSHDNQDIKPSLNHALKLFTQI